MDHGCKCKMQKYKTSQGNIEENVDAFGVVMTSRCNTKNTTCKRNDLWKEPHLN